METKILKKDDYPETLRNAKGSPDSLFMIGSLPPAHYKYLCVIGSRHHSDYGKEVVSKLIGGLSGYPICIVSGLAIGIDSLAHEAALAAKLPTIAFPGSGLNGNILYPPSRRRLARRIVDQGGALLCKWQPDWQTANWMFPVRNEHMAAISHAVLVIEARRKSGTWSTIEAALGFGRDVLVVPGSIFSELSATPLRLMGDGAKPVTGSGDILEILGLITPGFDSDLKDMDAEPSTNQLSKSVETSLSKEALNILERVRTPISRDDLIRELAMPPGFVNAILVELEINGLIRERGGNLTIT